MCLVGRLDWRVVSSSALAAATLKRAIVMAPPLLVAQIARRTKHSMSFLFLLSSIQLLDVTPLVTLHTCNTMLQLQ